MENDKIKETFQYTYSAAEQAEIAKIRDKYAPQKEDKMAQLRRLDAGVTKKAVAWSIVLGVLGSLIMGVGMCCCLVWSGVWFIPGIVIGIIGMAVAGIAYPTYELIIKKEREKIAPEILRLTDELMK